MRKWIFLTPFTFSSQGQNLNIDPFKLHVVQGATILDQQVCIARWGYYEDEYDYWNQSSWKPEEARDSTVCFLPCTVFC